MFDCFILPMKITPLTYLKDTVLFWLNVLGPLRAFSLACRCSLMTEKPVMPKERPSLSYLFLVSSHPPALPTH
jgi:hypothetical protein